jgi:hypothetical protein
VGIGIRIRHAWILSYFVLISNQTSLFHNVTSLYFWFPFQKGEKKLHSLQRSQLAGLIGWDPLKSFYIRCAIRT